MPPHPLADNEALYRRLVTLARHWLGQDTEAEDLVQDAYLRTSEGILPAGGQEAWLVTVLRHLCLDRWRRRDRYRAALQQVGDDSIATPGPDLPDQLAARDQRVDHALLHLVRMLTAGDVATLLLFEIFEFTHAELGELAGRSEAAARQRLRRMLRRIRLEVPEEGPHDEDTASLYALCRQALMCHDPAPLVAVVRATHPQVMLAAALSAPAVPVGAARPPRAQLIQRGDQMALLIQTGDGVVACLPLGETVEALP